MGLGAAVAAVSVVGSVISGIGAINSAEAQSANAKYQSEIASNNEQIAQQNAQLASAAGEAQVEQSGIKTRAAVGAIEAAQGASNIDVNSGSAVDVRASASELGQLDALTIRSNAEKQVYGYETQATAFAGQAALSAAQASQAPEAGAFSAVGSVLSGVTGAAKIYQGWQQVGGSTQLVGGTPSPW